MINMDTREPVYSGKFYKAGKENIIKEIEACFSDKRFGPGLELPLKESRTKNKVIALVAPHAGYMFSGMGAAHTYKELFNSNADTFVILAPNHTGIGRSSISRKEYKTPLGVVRNDEDCINYLLKDGFFILDDAAHEYEHSLEVQLPFLQYIYQKNEFKIIPMVLSSIRDADALGENLGKMMNHFKNKNFCIIASSDFTHYGDNYGFSPFKSDPKDNVKKLDMGAVELILKLQEEKFHEYIENTGATICGYIPIYVLMHALNALGRICQGKLLNYYTSGDVMGDYKNSVSYASIAFYEK
jgi:MEMO1 family protein